MVNTFDEFLNISSSLPSPGRRFFPFIDITSMYPMGDVVVDSERKQHAFHRITNRSIVLIAPHTRVVRRLHRHLEQANLFVFLMYKFSDAPEFPRVLFDSPRILLVLSHNIPRWLSHRKLVPYPYGSHLKKLHLQQVFSVKSEMRHLAIVAFRGSRHTMVRERGKLRKPTKTELMKMNRRHEAAKQLWDSLPDVRPQIVRIGDNIFDTVSRNRTEYLSLLKTYRFVLSPPGEGIETFRFYETMMSGRVPVVQALQLPELYSGLPTVVVPKWNITSAFLEDAWQRLRDERFALDKLFIMYWVKFALAYCLNTP